MKKALMGLALMFLAMAAWAGDTNRPITPLETTTVYRRTDDGFRTHFTTTVPANVATMILSTMTFNDLEVAAGITFTPTLTASTVATQGGRAAANLQIVSSSATVSWAYSLVDLSTTTSWYVTQGTYWSPDDPVAWQGPLYMKSTQTFTVTGDIFFERRR